MPEGYKTGYILGGGSISTFIGKNLCSIAFGREFNLNNLLHFFFSSLVARIYLF